MKQFQLGEFEEIVMLTVAILHEDAYGVTIKTDIEERLSRSVSVGALQTALQRLEQKGYLKSKEGETTTERAGRPRRYFTVTSLGKRALEFVRDQRNELWNAIPKISLQHKFSM